MPCRRTCAQRSTSRSSASLRHAWPERCGTRWTRAAWRSPSPPPTTPSIGHPQRTSRPGRPIAETIRANVLAEIAAKGIDAAAAHAMVTAEMAKH